MHTRPVTFLTTVVVVAGVALVAGAGPAVADASTPLYVNNTSGSNCSDTGTGTQSQPYCKISEAIAAIATAQSPQTINITGTYSEHVTIDDKVAPGQPITLQHQGQVITRLSGPDAGFTIDHHDNVSVSTISVTGVQHGPGVAVSNSRGIALQNVVVSAATPTPGPTVGIQLTAVTDSSIVGGSVAGFVSTGIALDATTTGVLVKSGRPNAATAYGQTAIDVAGSNNKIIDNLVRGGNAGGILLEPGATNNVVADNALSYGRGFGIHNNGATGTAITNNTVQNGCGTGIRVDGASSGVSVENNLSMENPAGVTTNQCSSVPEADTVEIGVYGDAMNNPNVIDYNTVYEGTPGNYQPYAWGTPMGLDAFRTASRQAANDIQATGVALVPGTRDNANSAAPGFQPTDRLGRAYEDDPAVPNTGPGPIGYADRGSDEAVHGPTAVLAVTADPDAVHATADASKSTGWVPIASYTFDFGDGSGRVTQSSPIATHSYARQGSYTVSVTATDTNSATSIPATAQALVGNTYTPTTPVRVLDTRDGTGLGRTTKLGAGETLTLPVAGRSGVPAGASAVILNVTVTEPTANGYLAAYPYGQAKPEVSNLNFAAGQTIANLVTVPVVDGKVSFYNPAGNVHVIADLSGYFAPGGAGNGYTPVTPSRVLDTRDGTGLGRTTKLGAGETLTLPVAGRNGVPTDATAVILNVTVTETTANGFLAAYPHGQPWPGVSNLNFGAGATIPNLVTVPVTDGQVNFYNPAGSVHVIADVFGYYSFGAGSIYVPSAPSRMLDTRNGAGLGRTSKLGPGETLTLPVAGRNGVPATATAVILNVTVTETTANGFLAVYPHGQSWPGVSNLNFGPGATIPNLVVVPVTDGQVNFYNPAGSTHVIADLFGYYTD